MDILVRRARHVRVGQARGQDGRHQVRERRDPVHEDPEAGHGIGAGQHAAEEQTHHEEDVGEVAAHLGRVCDGDAGVGEGAGEDEELPEQEPHQDASRVPLVWVAVAVEPDGIVDTDLIPINVLLRVLK